MRADRRRSALWIRFRARLTPRLPMCASGSDAKAVAATAKIGTPVDGNGLEALVARSLCDEFLQQSGKLDGDDAFARETLSGPLLERRHQETRYGRSGCRRNQIAASQHRQLAGPRPCRGQREKDCEVLHAHTALAMRLAGRQGDALKLQIREGTLRRVVRADGGALDVSRDLDAAEELQHVAVDTGVAACDRELQERREVAQIVQVLASQQGPVVHQRRRGDGSGDRDVARHSDEGINSPPHGVGGTVFHIGQRGPLGVVGVSIAPMIPYRPEGDVGNALLQHDLPDVVARIEAGMDIALSETLDRPGSNRTTHTSNNPSCMPLSAASAARST